MKFLLLLVVVASIFFNSVFCGITTIPNAVHKDHPGKCYLGTTKPPTILNPGDTSALVAGKCERIICNRALTIEIHTCGDIQDKKGCKKQETTGRPYPECCPRMKCN